MLRKAKVACQVPRIPHLLRLGSTTSKPGRSGVTMNAVTLSWLLPLSPTEVRAITVIIPATVPPGGRFQANIGGKLMWLTCPLDAGGGETQGLPSRQMLVDPSGLHVSEIEFAIDLGDTKNFPVRSLTP